MARKQCKEVQKSKERKEKFIHYNTLDLQLSNDQIEARQTILNNSITILLGMAGSGKTMVACYTALKALFDGDIEKIIITRPMISNEDMGFLPGMVEEKYTPWLKPIFQNFSKMYDISQINGIMNSSSKRIEMLPLQFTRGITYDNAYVIIDEAQNLTTPQIKMCMTRIGQGSKIIFCGDLTQNDLRKKQDSGLSFIVNNKFHEKIQGLDLYVLTTEHREQIIIDILKEFEELNY